MRKRRGFTLAELLIVVAIIAVLVAISIPIFTSQLEKSREAVDAANIRAQYAEVMTEAITSGAAVNADGAMFGKIALKQQVDNWIDGSPIIDSLKSISNKIVGEYPKSKGVAWVEYNKKDGVIIHYDGGSGAGGGTNAGGNTGSGTGSTTGNNTGSALMTADGGLKKPDGTSLTWAELTDENSGILTVDKPNTNNTKFAVTGVKRGLSVVGKLVIKDGLTDIAAGALRNQTELTEVVYPDTMRVISSRALTNTGISTLEIPSTIKELGESSFSQMSKLKTVNWHYSSGQEKSAKYLFEGSGGGETVKINFYGTEADWKKVKNLLGTFKYEKTIIPQTTP